MLKNTKTIRKLNDMEAAFTYSNARLPLCVVCVLQLQKIPEDLDWKTILQQLQQRHLLLQCGISERSDGYYFEKLNPVPPIPFIKQTGTQGSDWKLTATEAVNTIFDISGPLMKCWYVQTSEGENSELVICFHHSIIDGISARLILHEILSLAGGLALEPSEQFEVIPQFPTPFRRGNGLWKKLASFFARQFKDEWRYRSHGLVNPIPRHSGNELISLHLDAEVSRRLSVKVGRAGLSLNSVLLAAIAAAVIRHRYPEVKGKQARVLSFADLRTTLEPAVPNNAMGCYISMLRLNVSIDDTEDIWELVHRIRKAMYQASRRGEVFLMSMMSKQLVRLAFTLKNSRLGVGAISFIGKLDLQAEYGPIQLKHVRAFITNNQYGPELSAFGKILFGRISLDFTYLNAETDTAQASKMIEEIKQTLEKMAE